MNKKIFKLSKETLEYCSSSQNMCKRYFMFGSIMFFFLSNCLYELF